MPTPHWILLFIALLRCSYAVISYIYLEDKANYRGAFIQLVLHLVALFLITYPYIFK